MPLLGFINGGVTKRKEKKITKFPLAPMGVLAPVSAHAGTFDQPPISKFSGTRVCRVDFTKFTHFLVKTGLIGGIGGIPQITFSLDS